MGYRASALKRQLGDSAEAVTQKRAHFFSELGSTFMPGTPLMQAPLGLSAYIPAVIDPPEGANLPDEIAAIVYASKPIYDYFHKNSLSRRIYTHSHTAVFDMQRSIAQFPGTLEVPEKVSGVDGEHFYICLDPERLIDWQNGSTRVLFITAPPCSSDFPIDIIARVTAISQHRESQRIDQVLVVVSDRFAAMWLHGPQDFNLPQDQFSLVPEGGQLLRNLVAQPASVIGDSECGVSITGAAAFNFRFERRIELFG